MHRQDESGRTLAKYEGPSITGRVGFGAPEDSVCLRFIDPWSDTIFNQLQIPVQLEELDRLAIDPKMRDCREGLTAVSEFVRLASGQVHKPRKLQAHVNSRMSTLSEVVIV